MLQVFGIWRALKGWKTILASVGVAIAGVLQTTDWATIVGPQATGPTLLAIGIGTCDPEVPDRHPGRTEGTEIAWFRRRSAGLTLRGQPFAVYSAFRRYSGSASYQGPHVWENSDQSSARRSADRIRTDRFRHRGVCGQLPVGGRCPGRGAERRSRPAVQGPEADPEGGRRRDPAAAAALQGRRPATSISSTCCRATARSRD